MSILTNATAKRMPLLNLFKAGALISFLLLASVRSWAQVPNEDQVKAVFVYNFTHFIKWPATTFESTTQPFVIGVFGKSIASYLEEIVEEETFDGHPIKIRRLSDVKDIGKCQILFLGKPFHNIVSTVVKEVAGKPVLTVSDADNFMQDAGLIRLYNENNKIRLQINGKKLNESHLEASAKLLNLATIYN